MAGVAGVSRGSPGGSHRPSDAGSAPVLCRVPEAQEPLPEARYRLPEVPRRGLRVGLCWGSSGRG